MARINKISRQSSLIPSPSAAVTRTCGCTDLHRIDARQNEPAPRGLLKEFDYHDVQLHPGLHQNQLEQTIAHLMAVDDDSYLKPYRERAGQPAPGADIGGWYANNPAYAGGDDPGFAPGHCFGQWLSALCRAYAIDPSQRSIKDKVHRLVSAYSDTISEKFYIDARFPAYTYDKLVGALLDAHQYCGDKRAMAVLNATTDAALPYLPKFARERYEEVPGRDYMYSWDESYTLPENLFRAYRCGAGARYKSLAIRFLMDDTFFNPLAAGIDVLPGKHAYSYTNALSSAMAAYFVLGSTKHLLAATNGMQMIQRDQSYSTGGWGPDETFQTAETGALGAMLDTTHRHFETPCGALAHFKLTRALLRVTHDAQYGDSMERMMYNTVLGALPMDSEGYAFYYQDYGKPGEKFRHPHKCPCCAGSLPLDAVDYRINCYLRDRRGIFVNLYVPSTLSWSQRGQRISMIQTGNYPLDDTINFEVKTSAPRKFALRLRVPRWTAQQCTVVVNGKPFSAAACQNGFLTVDRKWRNGDRLTIVLPMQLRVEAVDDQHPNTVALVRGPLVLFAVAPSQPEVTREQLLAARRASDRSDEFLAQTSAGTLSLRPFTSINSEKYWTYLNVTQ